MKELSLNILDIVENSAKAEAKNIGIALREEHNILTLTITDDGKGMTHETLESVTDPFYTTRTTRKVGLGIPLLILAAEQTGGKVTITSRHIGEHPEAHGTTVTATLHRDHIDAPPLGDVIATVVTVIQGHPDTDFLYTHTKDGISVSLDTKEMREILGEIPLSSPEILVWIADNLREQYGIPENKSSYPL